MVTMIDNPLPETAREGNRTDEQQTGTDDAYPERPALSTVRREVA